MDNVTKNQIKSKIEGECADWKKEREKVKRELDNESESSEFSQSYSAKSFLDDLKKAISNIVPIEMMNKKTKLVHNSYLSKMLGQSPSHIKYKYHYIKKENPNYIIPLEVLVNYLINLEQSIHEINSLITRKYFNKYILPIFYKYQKCNNLPKTSRGIYRHSPKFKENYFKRIDSIEKAYWLGWIFAEAYVRLRSDKKHEFRVEIGVDDDVLMKRFINKLKINPNKVKYRQRTRVNKNGKSYILRTIYLEFKNKDFTDNLENLGIPLGKKSNKIKFPNLGNKKLQLAFLLGFFDGDGTLRFSKSGKINGAKISSNSRKFISAIKNLFNLNYVISHAKYELKDGSKSTNWRINLGLDLYNQMMSLQLKSLERKRASLDDII